MVTVAAYRPRMSSAFPVAAGHSRGPDARSRSIAAPNEWRGFAPSQSAARRGPKRNEVNIVHHDG